MNSLAGQIQDSELEIMRVLWKSGKPVALIDIRRELSAKCGWEDSTIKTLLRRLCEKGIAKLVSRGMYIAVVTQAEYNQWSTRHYVGKVFEGSAKKLVASLLSDGQLSDADIAELSAMFNGEALDE
ncbi:MAG: BlaI/MecI/CopY family transcriptional regulator [Bacillota bacterium]